MPLKIGILGGIGPEATALLYKSIINYLQKSIVINSNSDYPQIIINSIPVPELIDDNQSNNQIIKYITGIKELMLHAPDFVVMACNTVHLYRKKIIDETGCQNILSIRDIVGRELVKFANKKICILATPLTIKRKLYYYESLSYCYINDIDLIKIARIIKNFSTSGNHVFYQKKLLELVDRAKKCGANLFVAACTEISLLMKNTNYFMLDTLDMLARYISTQIVSYKFTSKLEKLHDY